MSIEVDSAAKTGMMGRSEPEAETERDLVFPSTRDLLSNTKYTQSFLSRPISNQHGSLDIVVAWHWI